MPPAHPWRLCCQSGLPDTPRTAYCMWAGRNQRTQAISGSTACFNAVFTFARTRFGGYNKRTTIRYNLGARHAHLPLHRDTLLPRCCSSPCRHHGCHSPVPKASVRVRSGVHEASQPGADGKQCVTAARVSWLCSAGGCADIARGHTVHTGLEDGKFDRMAAYFRERA